MRCASFVQKAASIGRLSMYRETAKVANVSLVKLKLHSAKVSFFLVDSKLYACEFIDFLAELASDTTRCCRDLIH